MFKLYEAKRQASKGTPDTTLAGVVSAVYVSRVINRRRPKWMTDASVHTMESIN